jgi:hypothetical protein
MCPGAGTSMANVTILYRQVRNVSGRGSRILRARVSDLSGGLGRGFCVGFEGKRRVGARLLGSDDFI